MRQRLLAFTTALFAAATIAGCKDVARPTAVGPGGTVFRRCQESPSCGSVPSRAMVSCR